MKKKILTLFLAFAIMMTFMPSMAFATPGPIKEVNVTAKTPSVTHEVIEIKGMSAEGADVFCNLLKEGGSYYPKLEPEQASELSLAPANYTLQFVFIAKGDNYFPGCYDNSQEKNVWCDNNGNGVVNGTPPTNMWVAKYEDGEIGPKDDKEMDTDIDGISHCKCLVVEYQFTVNSGKTPKKYPLSKKRLVTIAAIAAAAVVAVGTVAVAAGSSLTGGSKNVKMQQAAFQAKMQQQMAQKQAATIKTVLKGAGVVLSLASFGSSLGKLFQLNQFGFNPFVFR